MTLTGKIIFYNDTVGSGIILTEEKYKFTFSIKEWEDFDFLPSTGFTVKFTPQGDVAKSIIVVINKNNTQSQTDIVKKQPITTESVIQGYFNIIHRDMYKFTNYNRAPHGIDFLKLRRFLFTSFNNLVEIDSSLIQTEVNNIKEDMLRLSAIYDSFKLRSKHTKKAFHELFLDQSDEFLKAKEKLEKNSVSLGQYELSAKMAEAEIATLENSAGKNDSLENNYELIESAIKKARTVMIDAIHNKRELEDENKRLSEFIEMMISENEESFKIKFTMQAQIFNDKILALLNKVAYVFETKLWKRARKSRFIRKHFSRTQAKGRLSSTSYLKYYLQSLDMEKLSDDKKELFELLPYMENLHTRTVVYLYDETVSAQKMKQICKEVDEEIDFKASTRAHQVLKILDDDLPDFLLVDQKADFKTIFHYLKKYELENEITIIFFMDRVTTNALERAKQLGIDHIVPNTITNSKLSELIREYMM